jgi:hypothetical protein
LQHRVNAARCPSFCFPLLAPTSVACWTLLLTHQCIAVNGQFSGIVGCSVYSDVFNLQLSPSLGDFSWENFRNGTLEQYHCHTWKLDAAIYMNPSNGCFGPDRYPRPPAPRIQAVFVICLLLVWGRERHQHAWLCQGSQSVLVQVVEAISILGLPAVQVAAA